MRISTFILSLLAISLLSGCHIRGPKPAAKSLSLYVVNSTSVDGGRFINTQDFPKLGYIRPVPDLVIYRLKAAGLYKLHTTTDVEGSGEHTESWGKRSASLCLLPTRGGLPNWSAGTSVRTIWYGCWETIHWARLISVTRQIPPVLCRFRPSLK